MKRPLRIVVVGDGAESVAGILVELGDDAVAADTDLAMIGKLTDEERADVALVLLSAPAELMQEQIDPAARDAACPVIGLVLTESPAGLRAPARHAAFDVIVDRAGADLGEAIDTALGRFVDYHELHGAFGRRAAIEQATGILMAVHAINAETALELLRAESVQAGCELVETAESLVRSHLLLLTLHPRRPPA